MMTESFSTGHIGLNVSDLDRSSDFYRRVFDLESLGESRGEKRYVFLGREGRLILTLWEQSRGRFATDAPGLHHLAFQTENMEEVEAVRERLLELGVEFLHDGIVAHSEGSSSGGIFFTDPDGIRLEIYSKSGAERRPAPAQGPACGFF